MMLKSLLNVLVVLLGMSIYQMGYSQDEQNTQETPPSTVSDANSNSNSECQSEGVDYQQGALVLNTGSSHKSRIYQIQNIASGQLKLDHFTETDPGMSAGWASSIDPGMYSLLAMNQPNFAIKCMINNPPVEWGLIDCRRVLQVCSITPKQALGSFWVLENRPLAETLKILRERRIIP
jgi:hypothetical protein